MTDVEKFAYYKMETNKDKAFQRSFFIKILHASLGQ